MRIFNSKFEVSMRVLLLLSVFKKGLDLDKIMYLDFFTIYSKNYGLDGDNINGENDFRINSMTLQPSLYKDAIKSLALEGLVDIECNKGGFAHKINDRGMAVCQSMESDYSLEYKKNAELTYARFGDANLSYLKKYAKGKEIK